MWNDRMKSDGYIAYVDKDLDLWVKMFLILAAVFIMERHLVYWNQFNSVFSSEHWVSETDSLMVELCPCYDSPRENEWWSTG